MRTLASQPSRFYLLWFSCSDIRGSSFLSLRPLTMMPAEEVWGELPRMPQPVKKASIELIASTNQAL